MFKKTLYIKPQTQIEKATLKEVIMLASSIEKYKINSFDNKTKDIPTMPTIDNSGSGWSWDNDDSNNSDKDSWTWAD